MGFRQRFSASRGINAFVGRRTSKRRGATTASLERLEDRTLLTFTPVDSEVVVNTYQTSTQSQTDVAIDAAGNFVVVWESYDQGGPVREIYGQRFASNGTPVGGEFHINTFTSADQSRPSVAMADDGRFVVVWESDGQDGNGSGIYAQRYNANGVAAGTEFRVNVYTDSYVTAWDGDQYSPDVAMDAAGNFVVTWSSYQDSSGAAVLMRRFDAAGNALTGDVQVNTYENNHQHGAHVAMNATGQYVIVWHSIGQDGSLEGVYGQRYNSSGSKVGSEFRVNDYTTGYQWSADVAIDDSGAFVVVFEDGANAAQGLHGRDGSGSGIYARRYSASGTALGLSFIVNQITGQNQSYPSLAMRSDGSFVVTWSTDNGTNILAREYGTNGLAVGNEFLVNTRTDYGQYRSAIVIGSAGQGAIVWESFALNTSYNIALQRFSSGALPVPGVTRLTVTIDPFVISEAIIPGGDPNATTSATGTVTRTGDLSLAIEVFLTSSDPTKVTVPASVVIAAGQASATFSVNAVNDSILAGSRLYQITATTEPPPAGPLSLAGGFGTGGMASASLTMRYQPPYSPLAVQTDGKTVVASEDSDPGSWRIVRHNADGTLDTSFGTNGVVVTPVFAGALSIIPRKIIVQGDGKILVGGEIYTSTGSIPVFARYLANGALDTSFRGGNGNGVGTIVGVDGWVSDFGIRSDGKIWVALGFNGGQVVKIIRLTASGFHDTSFNNGNARDYTGLNFSASRLVVTSDNGFLVAGFDKVARMDANGNVVSSFGSSGVATADFGVTENVVGLALQADGRIIIGYYLFNGTSADFAAARLNANGSLDTTFSGDGRVVVDFASGSDDYAATMTIQPDGKILLGGWTDGAGGTRDSALARIGTDGELDATFDGDGKFTTSLTSLYTAELITGMAVQGNTLVALGGWGNDFKLARYVLPGVTTSASRNVIVFDDETVELVVDTLVDENDGDYSAGDLSLREAASLVAANGTIRFDASLAGGTINVTLGTISIGQFTIVGLGADQLTIKGNGSNRVFFVNGPNTRLSGVTITGTGIDNLYGLEISDCVFLNNTSTRGGAIQNRGGTLTISSTIFTGNSATWGGAIFNDSLSGTPGVVSIVDSVIQGNAATSGGGGIYALNGTDTTLVGVTISGNTSSSSAGGLFGVGTLTMINVTVSGNTAVGEGGGLDIGGPTTLRNVTIFGNRAGSNGSTGASGGGIRRDGGVTTMHNTLVAGNLLGSGAGTANDVRGFGTTTGFNNLIADGSSSSVPTNGVNGNIVGADWTTVIDPVLRDNGGPTMTHALLRSSIARDAGSNAQAVDAAGNPLAFDQRGTSFARFVGPAVDIGAYELSNVAPVAKNDDLGTPAGNVLSGNLFGDNGSGADADADGDVIVVSAVNGNMAAVGTTITLASGVLLRVNADGSFTYDPNGMFGDLGAGETRLDQFVYRIFDGAVESAQATVSILVSGADDAPVFNGSYTFSLAENSENGTTVGTVAATDPDGDDVRFSIVAGNASGAFAIDAVTGAITVADASKLDFETTRSFMLTVRATEQAAGMLFGDTVVMISLTDVVAPLVTQVRYGVLDSTRWVDPADLVDRSSPWKINRIAITFDLDVAVTVDMLSVVGSIGGSYAFSGFLYNAATRTAEWTLATPVDRDSLTLTLDGDDATDGIAGVSNAGEYLSGGDLAMSLDVLFGDVNGDGTVNIIDALLQRGRNGTDDPWADIDGNGIVNIIDVLLLRGRNGTTL